jgi:hypothetical protein
MVSHFVAEVVTAQDYYSGGMMMPGRKYQAGSTPYRYGFGGHEKDNEVKGEGNHLAFGDYGLDTRIGRRWNVEPLIEKYPSFSSYLVFGNNPILNADPDGKDIIVLAHGYREDPAGDHKVGHQAVLIGNEKDGWKFYSYDYDKGENKGSDANSANNIYTSGQYFKSLDEFAKSEYNTFKDDYDDGKGLETSHKDKDGKVLQRFTSAFQITTSAETDEKMKEGAEKTFKKSYNTCTGNQCTRVVKNALDAGGLKNGEKSKVTKYQGKSDIPYQTTEENYLPITKQEEIERSNKGTKIDEKIKR